MPPEPARGSGCRCRTQRLPAVDDLEDIHRYPGAVGEAWSDEENEIIVDVYLDMLRQELSQQHLVKAAHNRVVQERTGRSHGSVKYKFQNISAVLERMHLLYIEGYKPMPNTQSSLETMVRRELLRDNGFIDLMERIVDHPATPRSDVNWLEAPPPRKAPFQQPRPGRAGHVDFVAREAANRSLGHAGELAVLQRERDHLHQAGRDDLAARVSHASVIEGDGLGFDIRSWTSDGAERLIEVKTTRRAAHWPMIVTRNEVAVSRDLADSYVVARVFHFNAERVGIYELPGAIEDTCILEPTTFEALPAS